MVDELKLVDEISKKLFSFDIYNDAGKYYETKSAVFLSDVLQAIAKVKKEVKE